MGFVIGILTMFDHDRHRQAIYSLHKEPLVCSSLNLLFLMPAIQENGGLLILWVGMAGGEQVRANG